MPGEPPAEKAAPAADELKEFELDEIAKHNTEEDCWIVIYNKVCDITKYLEDHPGGAEIVLDFAGKDATEDFEDTGHSQEARGIMEKHVIGKVKGTVPGKAW